jgi:pimeloyl-ACP methyl ester carboxylesterase
MSQVLSLAPPGKVVLLPGRGEIFVRDSGDADAPLGPVLLLHGWMFGADLNWITAYAPLRETGYRVIAVDHRGHGRGIRTGARFRLDDCADDAAELLRQLKVGPALVVGYSMGGAIAQLMARRHPDVVRGVVLSATSDQWREKRRMRLGWRTMRALQFALTHYNHRFWKRLMRRSGFGDEILDWIISELERSDPRAIAEAGREMSRFDSRSWLAEIEAPVGVIVPTRDQLVPPSFQRALAEGIPGARLFEVEGDHVVVGADPQRYMPVLVEALADVARRAAAGQGTAATARKLALEVDEKAG